MAGQAALIAMLAAATLIAAEHRGEVLYGGLPLPGATVTVSRDGQKVVAITDARGAYVFPDLADGVWKIQIEMQCFASIAQDVLVAHDTASPKWELKLLPLDRIKAA